MKLKYAVAGLSLSAVMLWALGFGLAGAAPSNAPSSETDIYTCTDGSTTEQVTIVSNGKGMWTPGHVVSINGTETHETFIPLSFSGTFYPDTPINGQTSIEIFNEVKKGNHNGITNVFTCTQEQSVSADDPDNPYGVSGTFVFTATAFQAGDSH